MAHDLWEGIIPIELDLILHELIFEKKYFSLEFINNRINSFKYGSVEKENKPGAIILDKSNKLKFKQKAVKMQCPFSFLSFIIADKKPEDDEHWEVYLMLSRIVDMLYCDRLTISNTVELELLIEEHHLRFKALFPDFSLKKKKQHNMVHYPNSI